MANKSERMSKILAAAGRTGQKEDRPEREERRPASLAKRDDPAYAQFSSYVPVEVLDGMKRLRDKLNRSRGKGDKLDFSDTVDMIFREALQKYDVQLDA